MTETVDNTAEVTRRVDIAASKLAIRLPFIATVFSGMKRTIDTTLPTAGVKGMHVKFNPDFVVGLGAEELLFIAAHEAMHTCLLHSYRVGDRDPHLWNVAADAVINPELIRAGLTMPKNPDGTPMGVMFPWVKEEHDSEYVYKKLLEEQEEEDKKDKGKPKKGDKEGQGDGSGKGDPQKGKGKPKRGGWGDEGDLEPDDGAGDEGDGTSEAEVRVMIAQAARTAFASGDKSAMIQRILGVVAASNIDWKDELRDLMNDVARNDYSYRRFSKRFIAQDMYMPALYSEEMGHFGIGIDVSGSMTQEQLSRIQAELRVIIEDCQPASVTVVYCHSRITKVDVFQKGEEIELELGETGGTDMVKIVDYFEGVEQRLVGVVIFTDLETPFPSQEPSYPLVWGAVDARTGAKAPVGRTIEVRV